MKGFLKGFSIFELVIIALMAALGIAVKAIIAPLIHLITGPLYIPGGVVAGGIYMIFIMLPAFITKKKGAATLCGFLQGIMVLATGISASHGIFSLVTYALPGLAVDLTLGIAKYKCTPLTCFLAGLFANIVGSFSVNVVFFNMPFIPLMISLCFAALFGGLGGLVGNGIAKQLNKAGVLNEL